MEDLFNTQTPDQSFVFELFGDEVKSSLNPETRDCWHYIGLLAVPVGRRAAQAHNSVRMPVVAAVYDP